MAYTLSIFGLLVVLLIVRHNVQLWDRNRRLRKLGAEHGCGKMPVMKSRWPWGIDRIVKILRFKGDVLDERMHASFIRAGRWTHAVDGVFARPLLTTADPQNMRSILATNFKDWGVGERRSKQFGPFLGLGVFTSDGAFWEYSRSIVRPQFAREHISNLDATSRHLEQMIQCLDVQSNGWTKVTDLFPFIHRYTLDTATEFLFGESVESQATAQRNTRDGVRGESFGNSFEKSFETASKVVAYRMRVGGFYWLVNNKPFRDACQVCDDYAIKFIDKALQWRADAKQDSSEAEEKKAVFLHGLAESTQDRKILRDQLLQLLFAGRDTTASLLAFTFICLSRNPEAWTRLRAEVIEAFGTYDEPTAQITFSALKACAFLQNVLLETLRMFPPIPMNTRVALRDTVLPSGGGEDYTQPIAVAEGTVVNYSCYVIQRRTDIWGPDAAEWKPDRWIGRKFGFEYIPFNGGARYCPGQQFALTEAGLTLVRMAQYFDAIACPDSTSKVRKQLGLTLLPKDGVKLRFHKAEK